MCVADRTEDPDDPVGAVADDGAGGDRGHGGEHGRRARDRAAAGGRGQRDRVRRDGQHDGRGVPELPGRVHHAAEVRMGVHRHALDGVRGRAHRQRVGVRGRLQVRMTCFIVTTVTV